MQKGFPIIPYFAQTPTPLPCRAMVKLLDGSFPLHGHDYLEMELVLEGTGRQWVNNTPVDYGPGSLFLLTPEDLHQVEPGTATRLLAVHLQPRALDTLALPPLQGACICSLTPGEQAEFARLLLPLTRPGAEPYREAELLAVAARMVITLLRRGRRFRLSEPDQRLGQALRYIREHYSDPQLRLPQVAGSCGLSPGHFSKVFFETVGCHFADYVLAHRLNHACALLKTTDHPVTEVAFEAGFSGLAHFFRCFRAHMGMTPGQYRGKN